MSTLSKSTIRHEDVSRHAYSIWERNGRPDGNEQEHWYVAERELMQTGTPSIAAEIADDPRPGMAGKARGKSKR
jgi:hypothetical protein